MSIRGLMPRRLVLSMALAALALPASAMNAAEGFGAGARGGAGGKVLLVTRLDDDPRHATEGSLRWALKQKGPRIVRFAVGGDVILRDHIIVREPFLTIDGSTAPEPGVCLRNGSLEFKNTHDIIVRHLRIRLGDETVLRKNREAGLSRPKGSGGLDCVSLDDSERILFDHCSLSWSCDEIFGIVRCRDVTIQWCILSEPLTNPHIHPYGDNHAFCVNASANTLSIHHCLMHRFVMRGPQFECNDMRSQDRYTVRMEAVNNVISGYTHSGSRYSLGVEKNNGTREGKTFEFQFFNNFYIPAKEKAETIEAITRHGTDADVHCAMRGNLLLDAAWNHRSAPRLHPLSHKGIMPPVRVNGPDTRNLLQRMNHASFMKNSGGGVFQPPVPVTMSSARDACLQVLSSAGDSRRNDPIDARVRREVISLNFGAPVHSPGEVGPLASSTHP
jgi:hypothetical protein